MDSFVYIDIAAILWLSFSIHFGAHRKYNDQIAKCIKNELWTLMFKDDKNLFANNNAMALWTDWNEEKRAKKILKNMQNGK